MNYRSLTFKPSYETGINDLVNEFYIPVLQCSKRYDRIAGFFSSTSLALSARGLAGLIKNGGTMRLITCPILEPKDVEMIETSVNGSEKIITRVLEDSLKIEDDFQEDHVAALGWLLANNILEIRIALVYESGKLLNGEQAISSSIMHQKVGVLFDEEFNGLSFSGSNNESASGWLDNVEEFKVFCSWDPGQKPYFESDREKFERMWNGQHPSVKIVTLPQAVADDLIEKGRDFNVERISLARYKNYHKPPQIREKNKKEELKLFFYQQNAVDAWKDNDRNLLLEMATGCGKTRTAIGCIKETLKEKGRTLCVIACPGNTLSVQWKGDIEKLDIPVETSIICDGTNSKWRSELGKLLKQLSTGLYKNAVIYTTHQTCSSEDFISMIEGCSQRITKFFIGDEVHGMGAGKTQNGLLQSYDYRLGLSATPSRWFDEEGTKLIEHYFGDKSFVFSIHDALVTINPLTNRPFLVNFYYHPHFISLTEEELEEYKKLSDRIIKLSGRKDEDSNIVREMLLFKRANIEKSAENKYPELEKILDGIGKGIDDTIIFVSFEQLDTVLGILARRGISAHSFTERESTAISSRFGGISERQFIIDRFKSKDYKVLVAIKCLDEGIDIPSAKRAIVMASSTNPREYVQRVGRVIRQGKGKGNAEIYDMILKADLSNDFNERFREMEKRIFLKEMDRVLDLSENAINNIEVLNEMYKVKRAVENDTKHRDH